MSFAHDATGKCMRTKKQEIDRREFLRRGVLLGLTTAVGRTAVKPSYAASKERLTVLSSIGLDTLHPYAHSASPTYGIWQNMIEPLVEVDYRKKVYYGVLAESWEFQGKKWVFKLRKNVRFHDSSAFTAKDVVYSINRMRNDKESLQKENFRDITELQAADDHTVIITTAQPNAVMLDRLKNRLILSKSGTEGKGNQPKANPVGPGPNRFLSCKPTGNRARPGTESYGE